MSWTCATRCSSRIRAGVPFLGICLGLQALFESSDEAPEERGLADFSRTSREISRRRRGCRTWAGIRWSGCASRSCWKATGERRTSISRTAITRPVVAEASAICEYGVRVHGGDLSTTIFARCSFIPEKSGAMGLKIVQEFRMLVKRIIPCLDVTGGRVVKGVNFVNLRDAGDPVELAARYNEQGADELVFLDITASSDDRETMVDVVARTAREVFIPLTVGGGIRQRGGCAQDSACGRG